MRIESSLLSHRFKDALSVAAEIHAAQRRKGTEIPYISHLLGVTSIALQFGANEDEAIAALLHDSIEDAPEGLGADAVRRWIRFRFGEVVLAIVEGCTDADVSPKPPWRVRKESYVNEARHASSAVVLVSAADKLHNVQSLLADFRESGDALWSRFNPDAGKKGTVGYYRGLVSAYKSTRHQDRLVKTLDAAVSELERETNCNGVWPLAEA